ncbi:hypothetical protein TrVFT333_006469 [Trichoderma virens FT-333]|nr:hypothetical protein TrVFT333_006469 [Trichoderma virens FT-333]
MPARRRINNDEKDILDGIVAQLKSLTDPAPFHSHAAANRSRLADDDHHAGAGIHIRCHSIRTSAPAQRKTLSSGDTQPLPPDRKMRRREKNRVAQRAFRQRKENHVKQLEDKVAALEAAQAKIEAENAKLQQDLARAKAENTMLRFVSAARLRKASSEIGIRSTALNYNSVNT